MQAKLLKIFEYININFGRQKYHVGIIKNNIVNRYPQTGVIAAILLL